MYKAPLKELRFAIHQLVGDQQLVGLPGLPDYSTEFADAAHAAVDGLDHPAQLSTAADQNVMILIASDEEALLDLDVLVGGTGV